MRELLRQLDRGRVRLGRLFHGGEVPLAHQDELALDVKNCGGEVVNGPFVFCRVPCVHSGSVGGRVCLPAGRKLAFFLLQVAQDVVRLRCRLLAQTLDRRLRVDLEQELDAGRDGISEWRAVVGVT